MSASPDALTNHDKKPADDTTSLALAPCRDCGAYGLHITYRWEFVPKPLGSYSIAGAATKFVGTELWWPYAVCPTCHAESRSKIE